MTRKRLKDVAAIWRSAQGRRKERTATEGLKDISGEKDDKKGQFPIRDIKGRLESTFSRDKKSFQRFPPLQIV